MIRGVPENFMKNYSDEQKMKIAKGQLDRMRSEITQKQRQRILEKLREPERLRGSQDYER